MSSTVAFFNFVNNLDVPITISSGHEESAVYHGGNQTLQVDETGPQSALYVNNDTHDDFGRQWFTFTMSFHGMTVTVPFILKIWWNGTLEGESQLGVYPLQRSGPLLVNIGAPSIPVRIENNSSVQITLNPTGNDFLDMPLQAGTVLAQSASADIRCKVLIDNNDGRSGEGFFDIVDSQGTSSAVISVSDFVDVESQVTNGVFVTSSQRQSDGVWVLGVTEPPAQPSLDQKYAGLAAKFAPRVMLYVREDEEGKYRPGDVDAYLQVCDLYYRYPDGHVDKVANGPLSAASLTNQHASDGTPSGVDDKADLRNLDAFYLNVLNEGILAGKPIEYPAGYPQGICTAPCYYRIIGDNTVPEPAVINIQYWFFYANNGNLRLGGKVIGKNVGAHQGDWELVTVKVVNPSDTANAAIDSILLSGHGDMERIPYSEINFVPDTPGEQHPIVYSATDSHAVYNAVGRHERGFLPADWTSDGGPLWDTWRYLQALGSLQAPAAGKAWIRFTGRWGNTMSSTTVLGIRIPGADAKSPDGPAWHSEWDNLY